MSNPLIKPKKNFFFRIESRDSFIAWKIFFFHNWNQSNFSGFNGFFPPHFRHKNLEIHWKPKMLSPNTYVIKKKIFTCFFFFFYNSNYFVLCLYSAWTKGLSKSV